VALASGGVFARAGLERQVTRRYAQLRTPANGPAAMRERAALLEELADQREVLARRGAGVQRSLVAGLFAVPCPGAPDGCGAAAGVPCAMGTGIPVVLVRRDPVAFCHTARMRDAVVYGTARRDDILTQFTNNAPPEGIL
jgi:hypothetical protein